MELKSLSPLLKDFEHLLGDAGLVERLLGFVGKSLAVGGLVVEDRDVLAGEVLGDIAGGNQTLLVVAAADPQHVPQLALGKQRIGRARRNLQHVAVRIGFRGRDRRRRTIVAGDERNSRAGDLLGDGARLLRIASIVVDIKHQLPVEETAGGIDIGHRLLGAVLELAAERGFAASDRRGNRHPDVLGQRCRGQHK